MMEFESKPSSVATRTATTVNCRHHHHHHEIDCTVEISMRRGRESKGEK